MTELIDKKVLVLGGAGFIGGFVVEELLKHEVKEVIIQPIFLVESQDFILTPRLKMALC